MNIVGMDVFSCLMMDRIIFMGVPVNDYVQCDPGGPVVVPGADRFPNGTSRCSSNSPGGFVMIAGLGHL